MQPYNDDTPQIRTGNIVKMVTSVTIVLFAMLGLLTVFGVFTLESFLRTLLRVGLAGVIIITAAILLARLMKPR